MFDLNENPVNGGSRHRGFTLIELLVVITIIVLLVSIGTVTATRMRAAAETTSTRHLMTSLKNGLTQFYSDFGYYPPLLGDEENEADFLLPIDDDDPERKEELGFYSTLTLAPYLIGVGDLNHSGDDENDEFEDQFDDGQQGVGFRDPGADRSWGYRYGGSAKATNREDYWEAKKAATVGAEVIRGEVYGPYVETSDSFQFTRAVNMRDRDLGEEPEEYELVAFQFMDYWGRPIRYYRDWMENPDNNERFERFPGEWAGEFANDELDSARITLRNAPYVLFSMGRDREAVDGCDLEAAQAEENEDNLVEIGG